VQRDLDAFNAASEVTKINAEYRYKSWTPDTHARITGSLPNAAKSISGLEPERF
jgi:hypothetical protein